MDGLSPTRPPDFFSSPVYKIPFKKVPVVKMVFLASMAPKESVITPITLSFSTIRSITSPSITPMFELLMID